ncbi:MAG TPA: cold shock domain-containing protein [Acidimicrobiia bacterium]|nr:cold shock domain-containing protein [Acidimicrobiia bacterium]
MQGVVKVYDPKTGFGVVVLDDDRSEVFLRPGSLEDSIFRVLRQGQRIVFDVQDEDGTRFAHRLRVG